MSDETETHYEHPRANWVVLAVLLALAALVLAQGYVQQQALDREHACLTRHETLQLHRNVEQADALVRLLTRARSEHVSLGADAKAGPLVDEYVATITKINAQRRAEVSCSHDHDVR